MRSKQAHLSNWKYSKSHSICGSKGPKPSKTSSNLYISGTHTNNAYKFLFFYFFCFVVLLWKIFISDYSSSNSSNAGYALTTLIIISSTVFLISTLSRYCHSAVRKANGTSGLAACKDQPIVCQIALNQYLSAHQDAFYFEYSRYPLERKYEFGDFIVA